MLGLSTSLSSMATSEVYYNIRKHTFSVRHCGRVVLHTNEVILHDCVFVVRPGGRAQVLKTGHKNVHAFVKGTIGDGFWNLSSHEPYRICYNPFKHSSFVADDGEAVRRADAVRLSIAGGSPIVEAHGIS